MTQLRTFVAIETAQEVHGPASKLITNLCRSRAQVKWVAPDKLHLTLKFLGDVPPTEINGVCSAVQRAVAGKQPFQINCHGAGAFPDSKRPRTIWIGVREPSEAIRALQNSVDEELQKLGFPAERRRFQPYITLGRVRGGGSAIQDLGCLIDQHAKFEAGQILVGEIVVFSSDQGPRGPEYTPLSRVKLT
jgi:2'-5' RNA ligase